MDYDKLLQDFLKQEEKRVRIGSGDDQAWVDAMRKYIEKQKPFWKDFAKFVVRKYKQERMS